MTETVTTPTTETVVTGTPGNPGSAIPATNPATEVKETPEQKETFDEARAMALIEKLRGENRELSKAQKRLTDLEAADKKRSEAEMTELQKAQAKLTELETQLKDEKLARMRQAAAIKTGLPAVFTDRLKGETPEELEQDAQAIIEALPKVSSKSNSTVNPTNPSASGSGETDEQRRKRLFG